MFERVHFSDGYSVETAVEFFDGSTSLRKIMYKQSHEGFFLDYVDYYRDDNTYDRWNFDWTDNDLTTIWRPGQTPNSGEEPYAQYTYTALGRLKTQKIAGENPTEWHYDPGAVHPYKVTAPDGSETHFEYDAYGRVTKVETPVTGSAGITYSYDSMGNVSEVTDALSRTTTYTYDNYGHLMAVTNAENETTSMEYDEFGNMTK